MGRKIKNIAKKIHIVFMNKEGYIQYLRNNGMMVGENTEIDKSVIIGTEPWLIRIGSNTRISREVKFITHDGGIFVLRNLGLVSQESVKYGTIEVGNNCNIGWNAIIMPGVKIGNNCILAAGSVLTHNMEDNSIWGGVPAKFIESIDEYYKKNKDQLIESYSMNTENKRRVTSYLWEK